MGQVPNPQLANSPARDQIPVLEAINAAIIITDSAGVITYWNPFAERLYGWASEEVVGRNIAGVTVSEETAAQAKKHMAALQAGNSWAGEFQVRCKDGKCLTAMVTLSPVFDESGATTGIVGVSQDLSERRHVEEELLKARAELEKRVQERTAELNRANESLRDLSARLLQMRDHEARRIARDLHDSVGQLLVAISLNLAAVQSQSHKLDEAGARAVADNMLLVEQISREIRTISHLLHPPLLDEVGVASALRWYIDAFSERSKIKIEMEVPSDFGRLSTEAETAIFRIVQECLTNIHRHSGSKTAAIRIRQDEHQILVVAQDSGRGIPPDKLTLTSEGGSGVGFRGMRERIRHLGGNLKLQSDNKGTIVTVALPLGYSNAGAGKEEVA